MAPSIGVGAVVDEEAVLQVAGRQLAQQLREGAAQRVEQLLRAERHALELRLHRAHDLRVVDAGRVDAVPAEAVDERRPVMSSKCEPRPLHSMAANSPPSVTDLRYSR